MLKKNWHLLVYWNILLPHFQSSWQLMHQLMALELSFCLIMQMKVKHPSPLHAFLVIKWEKLCSTKKGSISLGSSYSMRKWFATHGLLQQIVHVVFDSFVLSSLLLIFLHSLKGMVWSKFPMHQETAKSTQKSRIPLQLLFRCKSAEYQTETIDKLHKIKRPKGQH